MTPIRALLDHLIDYAGLFPPAGLDMPAAVEQYAAYRGGPHAWMLGRFIVPLARLDELRRTSAAIEASAAWPISVLALPGQTVPDGIDSVETKIERAVDIRDAGAPAPPVHYFEISIANDPRELLAALAESGARAKIRMGGITANAYPGVPEVARFLSESAAARVPFKATAGLHHPIACPPMHGFANVFLAAALAWHGGARPDVEATLRETSAAAFHWDAKAVSWHAASLTFDQITAARYGFAIGFGSCSFEEPVADLQSLGWL